jgi:hypothetical protein
LSRNCLRQGESSRWFREVIKDESLAEDAARIEGYAELPPAESRARIKAAIERRDTSPA